MFDFKEALQKAQERLKSLGDVQEPIYELQSQKLPTLPTTLLEGGLTSDPTKSSFLANTIISAVRANPPICELYAELIGALVNATPAWAAVLQRVLWRDVDDPTVQFLIVLLLERGIITPQNMIDRVISAARPTLTPELGFYFFPEWATSDSFFEKYLEPELDRFSSWDHKYTNQCEIMHNGRDLSENDYALFKELRHKGQNHNPLAQLLAADDQDRLIPLVDDGKIDVNSALPRSLFERRKYGKTKLIRLVEYCALTGSAKCFKYLLYNNAEIGPRVPKYAAMLGHQEIIQIAFSRRIPLEPALIGGIKGHHLKLLRTLHEHQRVPIRAKALLAACDYKYKGLAYVLTRNLDFSEVMADAAPLQAEDRTRVAYEHILLIRAAEIDNCFIISVVCAIEGFDPFVETNQPRPTALIAAAASNSVDALRILMSHRGANVNQESHGETPLIAAAKNNAVEAIEFLATMSGIEPNKRLGGKTAFMVASAAATTATCDALRRLKGIETD
jgi:hypothetical protein